MVCCVGIYCMIKAAVPRTAASQNNSDLYCHKCFLWDTIVDEI